MPTNRKRKPTKQERLTRLLCLLLAILMIISAATVLIMSLGSQNKALAASAEGVINPETDLMKLRIGLMYGSNVTTGFDTTVPYGVKVHKVNRLLADRSDEELWSLDEKVITATVSDNLTRKANDYLLTDDPSKVVIGGWHLQSEQTFSRAQIEEALKKYSPDVNAYPFYNGKNYQIRVGAFATDALASSFLQSFSKEGCTFKTVGPSVTGVALVDMTGDKLLFEYDDSDKTAVGISAIASEEGEKAFLKTPAGKIYDGVFMFRRYRTNKVDGVSLTDIIPLGEYIKGVIPSEIGIIWPLEAMKAFAIVVRSYTLANLGGYEKNYQVDMVNSPATQVYGGLHLVNEKVEQAVAETAGLVMTYQSKVCTAAYSAVTGGCTVGNDDAWGSGVLFPYLSPVDTPWEKYETHPYGVWQTEVSPHDLYVYLHDTQGYTQLKGNIADVHVDSLCKHSTYVYQVTVTDIYGNKIVLKNSDNVRLALTSFLKSANFVVGKGSVKVTERVSSTDAPASLSVQTAGGIFSAYLDKARQVITGDGTKTLSDFNGLSVLTGNGHASLGSTEYVTKTIKASSAGNFIFAGKGWGHGVGLSQIGLRDLANLGYKAVDIVKKYYTGITVIDYQSMK